MTDNELKQVYDAVGDFCIASGTGDMDLMKKAAETLNSISWNDDAEAAPHIHNILFRDIYDPCESAAIRDVRLYAVDTIKEFAERSTFMHNYIFARHALDTSNKEDMRVAIDTQLKMDGKLSDPIVPLEITYLGMLYRMCIDLKDFASLATLKERWIV